VTAGGSGIVIARYRITQAEYFQGLDPDAAAYIQAVEAADGQKLENSVVLAIDSFVQTLKADGNWDAIKASCILCGARTLAGALVPLKGAAPTNYNFVGLGTDYTRDGGLQGDGSTKYLDSGRANNADPQNSQHLAAYATSIAASNGVFIAANAVAATGTSSMLGGTVDTFFSRSQSSTGTSNAANPNAGFVGISRSSSTDYIQRVNGGDSTVSVASQTPYSAALWVYRRGSAAPAYGSHAIAFYSIGEAVDLAALDTAVSTLVSEIGAAV